jgi:ribosome-associated protein
MLTITSDLAIDEREIEEKFVHASGPGGQNVNKVATSVQLRFDIRRSLSLPDHVRERLLRLAGRRVSTEGVLIIEAHRFRTQEQNRQDARQRLAALIRRATTLPKPRRPTKATQASQARRIESKLRRGQIKRLRRSTPASDD